jgi:hypothetical protein
LVYFIQYNKNKIKKICKPVLAVFELVANLAIVGECVRVGCGEEANSCVEGRVLVYVDREHLLLECGRELVDALDFDEQVHASHFAVYAIVLCE